VGLSERIMKGKRGGEHVGNGGMQSLGEGIKGLKSLKILQLWFGW